MQLRISVIVLLLSSIHLKAYVEGYDRLYHKKNGVVIDILHDAHRSQKYLSHRDMLHREFEFVASRLYKTERRILEALKVVQQVDPDRVELIWEVGTYYAPSGSKFLAYGHELVKNQFPQLKFVAGDIARDAFEDILRSNPSRRPRDLNYTLDGTSIAKPVPLPSTRSAAIKKNYGEKGWKNFDAYFTNISRKATEHYKKGFLAGRRYSRRDVHEVSCFDALCDIELLSYLLASPKKHIIVYCGGWHGEHLTRFLVNTMEFSLSHEVYYRGRELNVQDLAQLDSAYKRASVS